MVRFCVSLAVSLDGYIADAQGGVKWLDPFFTKEIDFPGFLATIGAVVMGRTTYDQTLTFGRGAMREHEARRRRATAITSCTHAP